MGTIVFKSFRLLPGALSSLQVIVKIISVLDAMFYPHTISASWRKAKSIALDTVNIGHMEYQTKNQMTSQSLKH